MLKKKEVNAAEIFGLAFCLEGRKHLGDRLIKSKEQVQSFIPNFKGKVDKSLINVTNASSCSKQRNLKTALTQAVLSITMCECTVTHIEAQEVMM